MQRILKMSTAICFLLVGTYLMAGNETQIAQAEVPLVNTVALAKKTAANTEVVLFGKLLVEGKKFVLKDSTGKITLLLHSNISNLIGSSVGQDIKITGTIVKSFWAKMKITEPVIKVSKFETVQKEGGIASPDAKN